MILWDDYSWSSFSIVNGRVSACKRWFWGGIKDHLLQAET